MAVLIAAGEQNRAKPVGLCVEVVIRIEQTVIRSASRVTSDLGVGRG